MAAIHHHHQITKLSHSINAIGVMAAIQSGPDSDCTHSRAFLHSCTCQLANWQVEQSAANAKHKVVSKQQHVRDTAASHHHHHHHQITKLSITLQHLCSLGTAA
jgi:hypothetical protein